MSKDKTPTSDRLRKDIDEGKAGDKVGFPDPAAAPLGTDAEAGGHPPTEEELEIARQGELKRPDAPKAKARGERPVPLSNEDEDDER